MTVQDPDTVDTIAEAPDGRLLLVMTEDRLYAGGDEDLMVEQLRQKMNAYVHLIRSGGLRRSLGRRAKRGADIELSCMDEPSERVQELVLLAAEGLAGEGVDVQWRVVEPPDADDLLEILGETLLEKAPERTRRLELVATLVGDGMSGGLVALTADGEIPMEPDGDLIGLLQALKAAAWIREEGTWLTLGAVVDDDGIDRTLDDDEPVRDADGFPAADWALELERYPRAEVPDWWRARLP